MRGRGALAAAIGSLLLIPATATAAAPPPGAAISDNLEFVNRVAGAAGITEGKFDVVRGKKVLVITGRFGFKTYDVSNPENPVLLDELLPAGIEPAGTTDSPLGGYWQNEDMELDTKRKLIIGALDPRHNEADPVGTGCPHPDNDAVRDPDCKSGFYVISYADPRNMRQIGDFVGLPSGHTSSCIQDCKYIWTGGPARRSDQGWLGERGTFPSAFGPRAVGDGRPIWVTDLRDPWNPEVSDLPVDLWRNDGYTDYSHDVDEDARGIAWVAGRGGIRGYATKGKHRDPYLNRVREATPFEPILVAGGGLEWDEPPITPPADDGNDGVAQNTDFMHNSGRPTDGSVRASGVKNGNVLIGTEEDFTTPCNQSGRIVAVDLADSWGGEPAQNSTLAKPYRMNALDSFHPFLDTPETTDPSNGCSAHYFEIRRSTLAAGWYTQGLRLVDVSNARNMRQVGYYRVTGTGTDNPSSNSWDVAWYDDDPPKGKSSRKGKKRGRKSTHRRGDYVYLMDMSRGIEVIRLKGGASASARMKSVTAPSVRKKDPWAAKPVAGSSLADGGYVCPLFTTS
jgi:hypothetical protein